MNTSERIKKRGDLMRGRMLIFLAMLCAMLLITSWISQQELKLEKERVRMQEEIFALKKENAQLQERVVELKAQQAELGNRMQDWLDEWEVDVWDATSYAPLDPKAKEGMCYSGDPSITASGAKVVPYVTDQHIHRGTNRRLYLMHFFHSIHTMNCP